MEQNKKNRLIEIIAFEYIIVFAGISRHIEFKDDWRVWILRLGIILIISSPFTYDILTKNRLLCILLAIVVSFFYISMGMYGDRTYFTDNFNDFIYTFLSACYIFWLLKTDFKWFWNLLKKHFIIFNGFYLANLIIISIQIKNTGFMIKEKWLQSNPFYPDHCSGFFGKGGTHQLAIFSLFMLVYNLQIIEELARKSLRIILVSATYISVVFSMYLSTKNENTAAFVLYVIVILFFYGIKYKITYNSLLKPLLFFIPVIVLFIVTLLIIPSINLFIRTTFIKRIISVTMHTSANAGGSNERLAIIFVVLKKAKTYTTGYGLGAWRWSKAGLYGFRHFGINSTSSFVTLGGIWFFILVSLLYTVLFYKYYSPSTKKGKAIRFSLIFIAIQILCIYTPILTSEVSMIWFALIIMVYTIEANRLNVLRKKAIINPKNGIHTYLINCLNSINPKKLRIMIGICFLNMTILFGARAFIGIKTWDDQMEEYTISKNEYDTNLYPVYKKGYDKIQTKINALDDKYKKGDIDEKEYDTQYYKLKTEINKYKKFNAPEEPIKPTISYIIYRMIVYGLFGLLFSFAIVLLISICNFKIVNNKHRKYNHE